MSELIGAEEICKKICPHMYSACRELEVGDPCFEEEFADIVSQAQLSHTLSRVPEPEWFTERFGCTLAEAYKYRIELIEQIGGKES